MRELQAPGARRKRHRPIRQYFGEVMLIDVFPHPTHDGLFISPDGEIYRKLSASLCNGGYRTVKIGCGGTVRRHTLVLETFKGPANGRLARHLNGDPSNDSLGNLEWGTQKENCADAIAHGTTTRGAKNARAKLNERDVLEIRDRIANGESLTYIAKDFPVTVSSLCDIKAKRTWGWL